MAAPRSTLPPRGISQLRSYMILTASFVAAALLVAGCRHKQTSEKNSPVTLIFLGWGPASQGELMAGQHILEQFTQETGIQLKFIPGPGTVTEQLNLYSHYLEARSSTPDVYLLDVIWPGVLAPHLLDLNPYLQNDANELVQGEVRNNTVDGKLLALPFYLDTGLLYYRSDLLQKYEYAHPPETWDELEKMAARIQAGERAAGNHEFWGYVWQGAAYEGLTCNALEWQASSGGGRIIEEDGTISVNNPQAIKAMNRAKRWIGTISPPGVTSYIEEDSEHLWLSGNAAFSRDWVWGIYPSGQESGSPVMNHSGTARIPSGGAGHVSIDGTTSLAISKYSAHPKEAATFLRYMTSRETQLRYWSALSMPPTREEFYENPQFLNTKPGLGQLKDTIVGGALARPSGVSQRHYGEVSKAYFTTVHEILTGKVPADKAMADLETELVRITALKTGPPPSSLHSGTNTK